MLLAVKAKFISRGTSLHSEKEGSEKAKRERGKESGRKRILSEIKVILKIRFR